ncbi:hypothetical protein AX14_003070, partial [Amanita brunnescens Koide BX004]
MNHFDVVADSEGEELEFGPSKATKALSSIETAHTAGSSLQRFSSIVAASLGTSWPHSHQESDASMLELDFPDPLSIADRAKTRQRSAKRLSLSTPGPSSRVPHAFDEDALFESYHVPDMLGEDDGEDYNARSRPKPRPKPKQKNFAEVWDNLAGYDHPTVLAAEPSGKGQTPPPPAQQRPKPRPVKRSPKTNVDPPPAIEPTVNNNNQEQQPTSQLSLPVPTSPLPPSDPPLPTPTVLNDYVRSIPPIVTLPDPPSSPSSLFSMGDNDAGPADDAHIPGVDD